MPARCHQDTCTVKWSEPETLEGRKYQADVDTDSEADLSPASPHPSIQCGNYGLEVKVSGAAGNIITNPGDGLWAGISPTSIPGSVAVGVTNNDYIAIGIDNITAGTPAPVSDASRSLAAPASGTNWTAVVIGVFEFFYTIPDSGPAYTDGPGATGVSAGYIPYNAQMRGRVFVDTYSGAPPAESTIADISLWNDISGICKTAGAQSKGSHIGFSTTIDNIPSGNFIRIRGDAAYVGSDNANQRMNIAFSPAVQFTNDAGPPPRGFRLASTKVIWIPSA